MISLCLACFWVILVSTMFLLCKLLYLKQKKRLQILSKDCAQRKRDIRHRHQIDIIINFIKFSYSKFSNETVNIQNI